MVDFQKGDQYSHTKESTGWKEGQICYYRMKNRYAKLSQFLEQDNKRKIRIANVPTDEKLKDQACLRTFLEQFYLVHTQTNFIGLYNPGCPYCSRLLDSLRDWNLTHFRMGKYGKTEYKGHSVLR